MTTERDVYQLDTTTAVASLQELGRAYLALQKEVDETKKKHEGLADMFRKDLKDSFMTAQAQYELLKAAFKKGVEELKEAVDEWERNEIAVMRLDTALRNAGKGADFYSERLQKQREVMESTLGIEEDHIADLQRTILTMGVGAKEVERFTAVSVALSNQLGIDATNAARMLARAHAEGKEELKKFGVTLSDTATQGEGFNALLKELEERTANANEALPEYTRNMNELKGIWSDLQKGVGGYIAHLVTTNKELAMFKFLHDSLKDKSGEGAGAGLGLGGAGVDVGIGKVDIDEEGSAKMQKEAADAEKKKLLEAHKSWNQYLTLRQKQNEAELELTRKRIEAQGDWEQKGVELAQEQGMKEYETFRDQEMAKLDLELEMQKRSEDAHVASLERKRETAERFQAAMIDQAKQYTEQILNTGLNALATELTQNQRFNRELFELSVQRETVGMSELEAAGKRADMESKLNESRIASFEKELAATLASVAKDSAIKAIMEGANAVASAAEYDYSAAAQHGIAAALYAGVAVTAGGAAYAISATRGNTADEQQQLEDARKTKKERDAREATQIAQRGEEVGTQVNVYYLGIAGLTEIEQGKELERIQGEYGKIKTGSG